MTLKNECFMYFADENMKAFDSNYYMLKYDKDHKNTKKIEVNECSRKSTDDSKCQLKTQGFGKEYNTIFYTDNSSYILFRDQDMQEEHRVKIEYKFYQSMMNNGQ